jgi:hypothetical protein
MFKHTYECNTCNGKVSITSEDPMNPLKDRLQTHGGVVNTTARKEDPFLAGTNIDTVNGSKGNGCYGALVYKGHAVAPPAPVQKSAPVNDEAARVLADMNAQFRAWDGTKTNRGAWWGSPRPGNKEGAKSVPLETVKKLQARCQNTAWIYKDSWTGGLSFHRRRNGVSDDFIYHMKPSI